MLEYIKNLITPDMVSLWVPSGLNRTQDLIRGNHGQCYGTHPNVPVISVPYSLNACDATTDWTGTDLSIDTDDKKEGTGSLKDDVAVPVATTSYITTYNPAGSWDWSAKKHILFWLKSDRALTAFTSVRFYIYDTSNNWRRWNLTFSAGEWTAVKKLLSTGDLETPTPPNLASIDYVQVLFKAADTTPFYKKIDDLRIAYRPSLINPSVGWSFDGVDDYVDIPDYVFTANHSICMWINPSELGSNTYNSLFGRHGNFGYIRLQNGSETVNIEGETDTNADGISLNHASIPFVEGTWYFVVITQDGSKNWKLYINGQYMDTDTTTDANLTVSYFGQGYMERPYDGYIALPFIAKSAWSVAKVNNFYRQTKGLFAPRG